MKDENARAVKAHIGSKILTSIVQDSQNNIQPASNSNSESDSDSNRVEHILDLVVTLQNWMTQEIKQQIVNRSKKLKKRCLSLVRLNTDGKWHEKTMCREIIYI